MIRTTHIHMQDSQIHKGLTTANGLVLWIHSSQLTIHNSQMNHNSQGNHSVHAPLSPQHIGTTPSPAAGGWDMKEMSWVLTHSLEPFPTFHRQIAPHGGGDKDVVVGGGCLFDPLLGWLANGSWFVCCGVCGYSLLLAG